MSISLDSRAALRGSRRASRHAHRRRADRPHERFWNVAEHHHRAARRRGAGAARCFPLFHEQGRQPGDRLDLHRGGACPTCSTAGSRAAARRSRTSASCSIRWPTSCSSSTALIVLLAIGRIPALGRLDGRRDRRAASWRSPACAGSPRPAARCWRPRAPARRKTLSQNVAIGALLFHYQTLGLAAPTRSGWHSWRSRRYSPWGRATAISPTTSGACASAQAVRGRIA